MKYQALLIILIIAISSFFIKVDAGKKQNLAEFITIESVQNNSANQNKNEESENFTSLKENESALIATSAIIPVSLKCSLNGSAAVLMRYLNQKDNLFEYNEKKHWPIASVSKLMSSIIALEEINMSQNIKISANAIATEGVAGDLKENEEYSVNDLIKAMLVVSSNDAAEALAESIGRQNFIDFMNFKAKKLNMNETNFVSPSGLSILNQSTPNDLIKLVNYIYFNHPEIFEITRQKQVKITELTSKKSRFLANINEFSGDSDFLGGKTGFIEESGRNLVSLFSNNGQPLLVIIFGAQDAFEETKELIQCIDNNFQISDPIN